MIRKIIMLMIIKLIMKMTKVVTIHQTFLTTQKQKQIQKQK